jgi:alpha-tubulin suppressor-like RCC1 family protein
MDHILILECNLLSIYLACGNVYSFGKGSRGELGLGKDIISISNPSNVKLQDVINERAKNVYAGVRTSFILLRKQNVLSRKW